MSLALHGQISERICEQIAEVLVSEVAEQFVGQMSETVFVSGSMHVFFR